MRERRVFPPLCNFCCPNSSRCREFELIAIQASAELFSVIGGWLGDLTEKRVSLYLVNSNIKQRIRTNIEQIEPFKAFKAYMNRFTDNIFRFVLCCISLFLILRNERAAKIRCGRHFVDRGDINVAFSVNHHQERV